MGLFGKKDKQIHRTFYIISEITKKGTFSTNTTLRYDKYPLFEDNKEANLFCKMLKQNGIDVETFGMKFNQEQIPEYKNQGLIFIGKKDDDLDYKCWNCRELISSKKVKWKPRTFKMSEITPGDSEREKAVNEIGKKMGKYLSDEQIASPNRIFSGAEYEYHGNCPKCNSLLNCFWLGEKSLEKNPSAVLSTRNNGCPTCKNYMRNEFQTWYSIRLINDNEENEEYLVTICPKCKNELVYPYDYDLNKGIVD